MPNLNIRIACGHLGKDPECKQTQNGRAVCTFSIATNNGYKKNGEWIDKPPTWHNVVVWGPLAEYIPTRYGKGDCLKVTGKHQERKYTGKDGTEHTVNEIVVSEPYRPGFSEVSEPLFIRKETKQDSKGNSFRDFPFDDETEEDAKIPF